MTFFSPALLFGAGHTKAITCLTALTLDGLRLLSASPELFFDWRDGGILSRPMKGTAARGHTPQADADSARALRQSVKEQAENLMIVDLIRNDLSRVAEPFSVRVPKLFETQAWPTIWQMTSDVVAQTPPQTRLADVFAALFPCGSVTGAPKVRAMHWIKQLEAGPRGPYCGAIGVLQPGGAATFNVAIRTIELRGAAATCGVGSGITADATATAEWKEWQNKQGFLVRTQAPFELLETLLLQDGNYPREQAHLARMQAAALHFGFVFDAEQARSALGHVADSHARGNWRVRLVCDASGQADAQAHALMDDCTPVRVQLASKPLRQAHSEFVRFKTTRREHYDAFAPADPAVFDTLLWNEDDELTEFTRGNVAVRIDGQWLTPHARCGLLEGIGRAVALKEGRVKEAVVLRSDLARAQGLAFINSVRGWLAAEWV
jgi:para-aminobenzoate synthetase/4-amino-4-deoxychorismate lyase